MWEKLTYKNRFWILCIAAFIALLISYNLAIKVTFETRKELKENEANYEQASKSPAQIQQTREQLEKLNARFYTAGEENSDFRDVLLDEVSRLADRYKVKVSSYPVEHLYATSSFLIETNEVVLQGNYKNLLKLLHHVENTEPLGKISAVEFYTEYDRKLKKDYLYLKMTFQNVTR